MAELDKQRKEKDTGSFLSLEQKQRAAGLLSRAQTMMDDQLDDVKHMNQLCMYAKVVTIRNRQLEENKRLEQEYIEEQKKIDLMMEIERLKSLAREDEKEADKKAAAIRGR